jgi:UDP-N-acetylmuramoyl-tripeptide--D-alanyl-D-alanine ligase
VVFPLGGRHYLADALAAWAIAREAGVGDAAAREALAAAKPLAGRGELFRGPVTLYRDSYNANPDSMREALAFCDALPWKGRKVYVLGEMRELGAASEAAHRAVLSALAKGGADRVFLYGDAWGVGSREWGVGGSAAEREGRDTAIGGTARLEGGAACSHHAATPYSLLPTPYTTLDALRDALDDYLRPGDFVLLKGSRACALEEVCSISALKDLIVNGGDS